MHCGHTLGGEGNGLPPCSVCLLLPNLQAERLAIPTMATHTHQKPRAGSAHSLAQAKVACSVLNLGETQLLLKGHLGDSSADFAIWLCFPRVWWSCSVIWQGPVPNRKPAGIQIAVPASFVWLWGQVAEK